MAFFNTQSKKRPLSRVPAPGRFGLLPSGGITTSLYGTAFVHPAPHGFCFASYFTH